MIVSARLKWAAGLIAIASWSGFAQTPPTEPTPTDPAPSEAPADAQPTEPPVPRADLGEVRALVAQKDYATAEEMLADLVEEFPEDAAALLMYGEVLLTLGVPDEARDVLARAAAADPTRDRVHFQLGTAEAQLGNGEAAIAAFGRELESSEDVEIISLARMNRALLFQQARKWDSAADELRAFLAARPEATQAYGDLATTYIQAGDLDRAREVLAEGEAAGFLSAQHQYIVGARLYSKKRYEDAESVLRHAIELDASLADAERTLGATLEELGRAEEAKAHLRRYLELRPDAKDRERILARIGT